ncbi:MAG: tRNA/tmRNA/rRNA uracil-C5-methylase, partial [Phycisphaerales bacterium]|nr:tRNA/tmRNA/rRNA uracil-C5-methylase [Phycisphaerales bacterium]
MILTVGGVAAGGACVGHAPDGRVVFVRYCLPGETVRVVVRSEGAKFLRADAVEVLSPSPDRVEAPCPVFGACGGCDWQHASPSAQLALKTALVRDQLQRIGRFTWDGTVEAVEPLWSWRTRMQWAGGVGLHAHRSAAVVPIASCPIAVEGVPPGPLGSVVEVTS